MAMFKSKEAREVEKLNKVAAKSEQLDNKMTQYGLENLSLEDKQRVKLILISLTGAGFIMTGSKAEDTAKLSMMRATMEQNFMIIKLLSEINNKLD